MEERNDVKAELTKAFEEKHMAFLTELAQMPTGAEVKEQRQSFFRNYPLRDDFQIEAMRAYRPGAYKRFMNRLSDPHKNREKRFGKEQDVDMASARNKDDLDGLVFAEAVNEAVCSYTGINEKGEKYNFLACLGLIYKQTANEQTARNELAEMGISDTGIPQRNLPKVVKMIREGSRIWQREGKDISIEELLERTQKAVGYECTKKEKELLRVLGFRTNVRESISPGVDEEGEPIEYQLSDEKNENLELEDRETARNILSGFCENMERKWALIDSAKDLRQKKTIKLFFSANIMKELKLDGNGNPYPAEPAGDEDFYLILEPQGSFLYREMLDGRYLDRALVTHSEDFYEVYAKLLRKDFTFSDTLIAELEEKNKSTISRERKNYGELMRGFYRFSREE